MLLYYENKGNLEIKLEKSSQIRIISVRYIPMKLLLMFVIKSKI